MKKCALLLVALSLAIPAAARHHKQTMKIEVVSQAEESPYKMHGTGVIGAIVGERTYSKVYMLNALVNGDKARLKCFENHRGCLAIGPGIYDAEVEPQKDGADVWIIIQMPVTHRVVRDHWKVSGTWGTADDPKPQAVGSEPEREPDMVITAPTPIKSGQQCATDEDGKVSCGTVMICSEVIRDNQGNKVCFDPRDVDPKSLKSIDEWGKK